VVVAATGNALSFEEGNDLSQTDNSEQSGTVDPDEQDADPAGSSPAEQAQERQEEMEESGQENAS
jgi:hypothetical protein